MNRLWTCTDAQGHWPVGFAAIILAPDVKTARALLDTELVADKLDPHAGGGYTLHEVDLAHPVATILVNGEY